MLPQVRQVLLAAAGVDNDVQLLVTHLGDDCGAVQGAVQGAGWMLTVMLGSVRGECRAGSHVGPAEAVSTGTHASVASPVRLVPPLLPPVLPDCPTVCMCKVGKHSFIIKHLQLIHELKPIYGFAYVAFWR